MIGIIAAIKESKREIEELKRKLASGEITETQYEESKKEVASKLEKKSKPIH